MRESCKTSSIQINGKRIVGSAQSVDPHIKLSSSEKQRIQQIPLTDIGLRRTVSIESFPARHISDLVENKYALALAFGCLHQVPYTGFIIHSDLLSFCVRLYSS